jgi:hypothetical protein
VFFHETSANPGAERFGYLDLSGPRTTYEAINRADEPTFETAEPCERCGADNQWLRVAAHSVQSPVSDARTGEVLRVNITDYPEQLGCANCQRLGLLSLDAADERMDERAKAAERQVVHQRV